MDKNEPIFWTKADGEKINVDDMTEDHLRNTLKMLIRNDWICIGEPDEDEYGDIIYPEGDNEEFINGCWIDFPF